MNQRRGLLMERLDGGGHQGSSGPLRAGEGDEPEAARPVQEQEALFGEQVPRAILVSSRHRTLISDGLYYVMP